MLSGDFRFRSGRRFGKEYQVGPKQPFWIQSWDKLTEGGRSRAVSRIFPYISAVAPLINLNEAVSGF